MLVSSTLLWLSAWVASTLAEAVHNDQLLLAGTTREHTSSCGPYHSYTAIGDSYACGFGSAQRLGLCSASNNGFGINCTTQACGQDIGSYSWLFSKSRNIEKFQYLACNGNDTGSVVDSQIHSSAFGDPDLVTVNMGGDDQSFFAQAVLACVVQYDAEGCDRSMDFAQGIIDGLPDKYARVFAGIKAKARPGTKVVAMSYAQFWGNTDTKDCAWPLNLPTPAQKARLNKLARDMNGHLRDEALKAGYLYGDVDAKFEGQRICDRTGNDSFKSLFQIFPKVGWDTAGEFYTEVSVAHPTSAGQNIMLKVLESALQC